MTPSVGLGGLFASDDRALRPFGRPKKNGGIAVPKETAVVHLAHGPCIRGAGAPVHLASGELLANGDRQVGTHVARPSQPEVVSGAETATPGWSFAAADRAGGHMFVV